MITKQELQAQLKGVREAGLYEFIVGAALEYKLPVAYLLAVASRETGMKNIAGDGGHGRGMVQIDDRSHFDICNNHDFRKEPALFIDYGAKMLLTNLGWAAKHWPKYTLEQRQKIAAAAYNCGCGNVLKAVPQGNCDLYTAHGDYGASVIERMGLIAEILKEEKLAR
jgi:hypothetical protein